MLFKIEFLLKRIDDYESHEAFIKSDSDINAIKGFLNWWEEQKYWVNGDIDGDVTCEPVADDGMIWCSAFPYSIWK